VTANKKDRNGLTESPGLDDQTSEIRTPSNGALIEKKGKEKKRVQERRYASKRTPGGDECLCPQNVSFQPRTLKKGPKIREKRKREYGETMREAPEQGDEKWKSQKDKGIQGGLNKNLPRCLRGATWKKDCVRKKCDRIGVIVGGGRKMGPTQEDSEPL